MAYFDNRYLKKDESDFVDLISSDIEHFIETIQEDSNWLNNFHFLNLIIKMYGNLIY